MKDADKWLGDYLNTDGLAASVIETITQREGKVKGEALEIAAIVDNSCVSSLPHNSGSWVKLSGQAEQRLESLQLWFLRLLLHQGPGVASGSLLWETKTLSMKRLIWR